MSPNKADQALRNCDYEEALKQYKTQLHNYLTDLPFLAKFTITQAHTNEIKEARQKKSYIIDYPPPEDHNNAWLWRER